MAARQTAHERAQREHRRRLRLEAAEEAAIQAAVGAIEAATQQGTAAAASGSQARAGKRGRQDEAEVASGQARKRAGVQQQPASVQASQQAGSPASRSDRTPFTDGPAAAGAAAALPEDALFTLLLDAARLPTGAAAGLTAKLVAAFCSLLDTLPAAEQATKVGGGAGGRARVAEVGAASHAARGAVSAPAGEPTAHPAGRQPIRRGCGPVPDGAGLGAAQRLTQTCAALLQQGFACFSFDPAVAFCVSVTCLRLFC